MHLKAPDLYMQPYFNQSISLIFNRQAGQFPGIFCHRGVHSDHFDDQPREVLGRLLPSQDAYFRFKVKGHDHDSCRLGHRRRGGLAVPGKFRPQDIVDLPCYLQYVSSTDMHLFILSPGCRPARCLVC